MQAFNHPVGRRMIAGCTNAVDAKLLEDTTKKTRFKLCSSISSNGETNAKCQATQPDKNASAMVCAWMSGRGITSGQRLNRSTMVNKHFKTREGGSGPTISRRTWANRHFAKGKDRRGVLVCRWTFERWLEIKDLVQSRMSAFIRTKTKRSVMSFCVVQTPVRKRLWKDKKILCRREAGTKGLEVPVEMSQIMETSS